MDLLKCTSCNRYVREATCPFCGGSGIAIARPSRSNFGGMTRAALLLGASVSVVGANATACSSTTVSPDAGLDAQVVNTNDAAYGGPPIAADAGPVNANDAAYGGPPIADAEADVVNTNDAAYGGPPIDAARD